MKRLTVPDWRDWLNTITAVAVRLGVSRSTFHTAVDQCYDDLTTLAPTQNVIPLGAGLTARQHQLLQYWYREYAQHGDWPRLRDARDDLNIPLTCVNYNLKVLSKRGHLVYRPGRTPAYITPSGHWAGPIGD